MYKSYFWNFLIIVHIYVCKSSFVRSVTMDSWSEKQIRTMDFGGNHKFNSFLLEHKTAKGTPIHSKYTSYGARLFKERLNAELDGREPPSEIAKEVGSVT